MKKYKFPPNSDLNDYFLSRFKVTQIFEFLCPTGC
jgi:hypothetical protein